MKHFLIYKTTHLPSGKFYLGSHVSDDPDSDPYCGSGTEFLKLWRDSTIPKSDFVREWVDEVETYEAMLLLEAQWVGRYYDDPLCLNLHPKGWGTFGEISEFKGLMNSEKWDTIKENRAEGIRKLWADPERRKEVSKKLSESTKKRLESDSDEKKEARKINHKNWWNSLTEEDKIKMGQKMSEGRKKAKEERGSPWISPETKIGYIRTEAHRKQISERAKRNPALREQGKKNSKRVRCIETGVEYESQLDAMRQTGIHNTCIADSIKRGYATGGDRQWHWEFIKNEEW